MPSRKKQKVSDMTLPTEMPDDSEDEDFEPVQASPSKKNRHPTRKTLPSKKKKKRKRAGSYVTDDDDEDDFSSEDPSEVSHDEDEDESDGSVGPGGRRRRRSAAQKSVNYRVDDSDNDDDFDEEPEIKKENENPRSKNLSRISTRARKSTTVSPQSANKRQTRATSARATSQQPPHTPFTRRGSRTRQMSAEPSRKSSRLHPDGSPVLELTASGNVHEIPTHPSVVLEEPESSAEATQEPVKDVDMIETDASHGKEEGDYWVPDDIGAELDAEERRAEERQRSGKKPKEVVQIDEDEEEDDLPRTRTRRQTQAKPHTPEPQPELEVDNPRRRLTRAASKADSTKKKSSADDDEEYQEEGEEEEEHSGSASDGSESAVTSGGSQKRQRPEDDADDFNPGKSSRRSPRKQRAVSVVDEEEVLDELEEILDDQAEMGHGKKRRSRRHTHRRENETETQLESRLRARKTINYNIIPQFPPIGMDDPFSAVQDPSQGPSNSGGGSKNHFNLFQTAGPFGGLTEGRGVLGPTSGFGRIGLAAGADSDSSDDEAVRSKRPSGFTVTSPTMTHNQVGGAGNLGNPTDMGKVRPKGANTTDSDPLGVDSNINFDSVGGLDEHINQLKDMVFLPLMYPELFQKFGTSPPKGVLFHGPPGTGKTLLARALAASCSTDGRKITFFMRKGADVMSKWVGEAERQLRMLFEEAKNCQPSIIFFDEIDGLAPVRSSKQEQIHASIVATMLALMDGMDGRGQIIVIGATNRPDSVDPALRRPGRFDREFYFPLPNKEARKSIINIHTKKWEPPLTEYFKDKLAELTKGYGGADLRALCTEAALNAIQRRYPQIYQSKEKLLLNLDDIEVTARDFMISLKKMIPSSERATSSAGSLLPEHIKPLLEPSVIKINETLDKMLPKQKKLTVLEEALYEDDADPETGFMKEMMLRQFESGRIFRPRLLIYGEPGMGQSYIGAAVLQHFEGYFVQSFDLASLMGDSANSMEATLIHKFTEIKRHKPAVIYIPNLELWQVSMTGQSAALATFTGLLRSIPANDPILVLGVLEGTEHELDINIMQELFGYSKTNRYKLCGPTEDMRRNYFKSIADAIRKSPKDFPDPTNRKKRLLEDLPKAPPPPPKVITDEELRSLEQADRNTLYLLQTRLRPLCDSWKQKYRKLRKPVIDPDRIRHLFEEGVAEPPAPVPGQPVFEKLVEDNGEVVILEKNSGKKFYNIDLEVVETRLANGFYHTPRMFLNDIMRIAHDARAWGDRERALRASELVGSTEVYINSPLDMPPDFVADCERVHARSLIREERWQKKQERKRREAEKRAAAEAAQLAIEDVQMVDANDTSTVLEQVNSTETSARITSGSTETPMSNGTDGPAAPGQIIPVESQNQHSSSLASNSSGISDAATVGSGNAQISVNTTSLYHTAVPPSLASQGPSPDSQRLSSSHPSQITTGSSANTSQATQNTERARGNQMQTNIFINDLTTQKKLSLQSASSTSILANTSSYTNTTSNGTRDRDSLDNSMVPHGNPDFSMLYNSSGDSQHPDTQSTSSTSSRRQSAAYYTSTQIAVLRETETNWASPGGSGGTSAPSSQSQAAQVHAAIHGFGPRPPTSVHTPQMQRIMLPPMPTERLVLDEGLVERAMADILVATKNFSVEQIEQVNAAMMNVIWETRGVWNRNEVARKVVEEAESVAHDIGQMQGIGDGEPAGQV